MAKTDYRQNVRDIIEFLNNVKTESPDNVMTMFFVQKPSREKYVSFRPQISNEIQKKILSMILDPAIKSLGFTVVPYNAVGVADEENELLIPSTVQCLTIFMKSIEDDKTYKEMDKLDISKIGFYCTRISYKGKSVYLFRQFSKMNKLRNSFMGEFYDDELREMDSDFLGIDTLTDIVYDPDYEILLVLNHISLERIFNYRDEFLNIANAAIDWTLAFKKSAVRSTEWKTVSESIR